MSKSQSINTVQKTTTKNHPDYLGWFFDETESSYSFRANDQTAQRIETNIHCVPASHNSIPKRETAAERTTATIESARVSFDSPAFFIYPPPIYFLFLLLFFVTCI